MDTNNELTNKFKFTTIKFLFRSQKLVWHGADASGARAHQSYCEAWHSDAGSSVGLASDLLKGELMGQERVGCNNKFIVLCVEIASQHHYRRKRDTDAKNSNFPGISNSDLNLEQYTHFINQYDQHH